MKEYSYGICPYKLKDKKAYILLNKTGRVGDWNFFKGKIEKDETIEECAVREFSEETGTMVPPEVLENFFTQNSPRKDVGIFLTDWTKLDLTICPDREEIFSYSWVEVTKDVVTSKNQQKIYDNIHKHLTNKLKEINV